MNGRVPDNDKKRESNSAVWRAVNRLTAYIYAVFANSRIMGLKDDLYQKSYTSRLFNRSTEHKSTASGAEKVFEQSRVLRAIGNLRLLLASLSLNIYGIFFASYGLASAFMYYIALALNGESNNRPSSVVVSVITFVCAIPMLLTNRSVSSVVADSKIMRYIVLNFFSIPEEKLRNKKTVGGTEYIFILSIFAVLLGIFTYFIHSAYIPIIFGIVILVSLIASNPETGVLITIAITPFLQYTEHARLILGVMIAITMLSYIFKITMRRRSVSWTAESVLVLIFCIFVIASSLLSRGGSETALDGIFSAIVIAGGFLLPFNLVKDKARLRFCIKLMSTAFITLGLCGLWNVLYNAVVSRNFYSLHESVSPIFENNTIFIADGATVFSILAVIIFPLVLSRVLGQKNFKKTACAILFTAISVYATFIYGTYEAVVVIAIETLAFFLLYSHKSMSAIIIAIAPVTLIVLAYQIYASRFGLLDISSILKCILPLQDSGSSSHADIIAGTLAMLKDGNLAGIGAGKHAFESLFPAYSNAVSAEASEPGSLLLQIICWSGLGGALCFFLLAASVMLKGIGFIMRSRDNDMKADASALLCSVSGALLLGIMVCTWTDVRMLYLFWVTLGLLAGYSKAGETLDNARAQSLSNDKSAKEVELIFHKSSQY